MKNFFFFILYFKIILQISYWHSKLQDVIICWPHCILDISLVLLFQALNIHSKSAKFLNWAPIRCLFEIKYQKLLLSPLIIHKDYNFAKTALKLHIKWESSNFGIRIMSTRTKMIGCKPLYLQTREQPWWHQTHNIIARTCIVKLLGSVL